MYFKYNIIFSIIRFISFYIIFLHCLATGTFFFFFFNLDLHPFETSTKPVILYPLTPVPFHRSGCAGPWLLQSTVSRKSKYTTHGCRWRRWPPPRVKPTTTNQADQATRRPPHSYGRKARPRTRFKNSILPLVGLLHTHNLHPTYQEDLQKQALKTSASSLS